MSGSLGNPNGQSLGVSNSGTPKAPRVYAFNTVLLTGVVQSIDLRALQNLNVLHDVQSIWIDNSANATACTISISNGQNIVCPPYSLGCSPAFVTTANPVFQFTGNGTVNVVLTNFPLPLGFWSAQGLSVPVLGGKAQVQDVTLEAQIINGAFSASEAAYGPGDMIVHARAGAGVSASITVASGPTVVIAGSPNAFVSGVFVCGLPGEIGTMVLDFRFTTAGEILTVPVGPYPTFVPCNVIGAMTGDNVTVTATGALTAASVKYTVFGGSTGLA